MAMHSMLLAGQQHRQTITTVAAQTARQSTWHSIVYLHSTHGEGSTWVSTSPAPHQTPPPAAGKKPQQSPGGRQVLAFQQGPLQSCW
jgi:hypothetical protein